MIPRRLNKELLRLAKKFPVISLTGPRQSGKTTLVKAAFPEYDYVSLENPDARERAKEDPKGFLNSFKKGVILDEVQKVPDLFSYIQTITDENKIMGQFILTGSQNFLLLEKIGQSLAGRVALLHLLPFSIQELSGTKYLKKELNSAMFTGMYPAIYDRKIEPQTWYGNYIATYLERDARQMKQIGDLDSFQKFMRLCAGRSGQVLNLSELGNMCGISHTTAKSWLSVLEASFIVFLLPPFHNNFNKRIIKQSKLYFYDTGLLCNLLGLEGAKQLENHYYRGAIFETYIISEFVKNILHTGRRHQGFFWRDSIGNEVDYITETRGHTSAVEIKSGETIKSELFKGLEYLQKISSLNAKNAYLVYGGDEEQERKYGKVIGWKNCSKITG